MDETTAPGSDRRGGSTLVGRTRTVPRRTVLRGAVATAGLAAAATTASGQETATFGGWFGGDVKGGAVGNYDGTVVDERGSASATVRVGSEGNGGPYAFDPPALRVDPGTTVTFDWVSDTHNTVVEEQPSDGNWDGHGPIENTGFSYEHTFEAEGVYTYYCEPHLPLGMKAAVVVGDVEIVAEGGDGGVAWTWPGGAAGVAFMALLFGTAGLAVALMAVGDGVGAARRWYGRAAEAAAEPLSEAAPGRDVVRELGHEEFDPVGTAALILVYFLVLVAMWVFVYFVEFLGNGPTVIGP